MASAEQKLRFDPSRLSDESRLEPNEPEIAAKVYDDEVVLLHLSTGVYGSIESCGALVWEAIEKNLSAREIAQALAARCDVAESRALADVRSLAMQLLEDQMVRLSSATCSAGSLPPTTGTAPYEAPRLVVYRDMEDLLALDPPLPEYAEAPWKKS